MKTAVRSWMKVGIVVISLSILGGCSLVHSELGEVLNEEKSFSEYWQHPYPGHETGNRNRYEGRK